MYVTPSARGAGLALRLSHTVINAVRERGYAQLALSTWADNAPAIALYRKLGFVEIAPFHRHAALADRDPGRCAPPDVHPGGRCAGVDQ